MTRKCLRDESIVNIQSTCSCLRQSVEFWCRNLVDIVPAKTVHWNYENFKAGSCSWHLSQQYSTHKNVNNIHHSSSRISTVFRTFCSTARKRRRIVSFFWLSLNYLKRKCTLLEMQVATNKIRFGSIWFKQGRSADSGYQGIPVSPEQQMHGLIRFLTIRTGTTGLFYSMCRKICKMIYM